MGADPALHEPVHAVQTVRGLLAAASCRQWLARIDAAAASLPAGHADLQPTSGSMRLTALGEQAHAALLDDVMRGEARRAVHARLGDALHALPGQCWARRQYPDALRPKGQAPHAWHQDGALHCRYDGSDDTLLDLVTVWVPLVACGVDAPSLQWIDAPTPRLLQPAELADAQVGDRFGAEARRSAVLDAGDALVFGGSLLHRSYIAPAMTFRRTSVELRFVAAADASGRLRDEARQAVRCPWTP